MKEIIDHIETEDLIEITDEFDLSAYIKVDNLNKINSLTMRIYKEGLWDGCGINLPDFRWEVNKDLAVEGLVDISNECYICAYLQKDEDGKFKDVIIGIGKEKDIITTSAFFGPYITPKILNYVDKNGKFKC